MAGLAHPASFPASWRSGAVVDNTDLAVVERDLEDLLERLSADPGRWMLVIEDQFHRKSRRRFSRTAISASRPFPISIWTRLTSGLRARSKNSLSRDGIVLVNQRRPTGRSRGQLPRP
jgi:hypothetical protein